MDGVVKSNLVLQGFRITVLKRGSLLCTIRNSQNYVLCPPLVISPNCSGKAEHIVQAGSFNMSHIKLKWLAIVDCW